jgi:hypothetical protein
MKKTDLNEIQIRILLAVRDDDGRTPTESIYDIVEEVRPTTDDDGEPIDDQDPYETSREEIGDLECGGLLDIDENTNWAGGASIFTKRGKKMAEELAEEGWTQDRDANAMFILEKYKGDIRASYKHPDFDDETKKDQIFIVTLWNPPHFGVGFSAGADTLVDAIMLTHGILLVENVRRRSAAREAS